jgi:hypothetical protein
VGAPLLRRMQLGAALRASGASAGLSACGIGMSGSLRQLPGQVLERLSPAWWASSLARSSATGEAHLRW